MKRVKLTKLNDILMMDTEYDNFLGFTTIEKVDLNGKKYELGGEEEKYFFLGKFHDNKMFISETHLFNVLLSETIDEIESGSIYSHGYPEARLIPSDFTQSCQTGVLDTVSEYVYGKIDSILSDYF